MTTKGYRDFVPQNLRMFVYVAGPISKGNWDENMIQATKAFIMLVHAGLVPFIPHGTSQLVKDYVPADTMHGIGADSYEFWLPYDFSFIRDVCHCVYRLPGESWGSEQEEDLSNSLLKPVFTDIDKLFDYAELRGYAVNREAAYKFGEEFERAIYQKG